MALPDYSVLVQAEAAFKVAEMVAMVQLILALAAVVGKLAAALALVGVVAVNTPNFISHRLPRPIPTLLVLPELVGRLAVVRAEMVGPQ